MQSLLELCLNFFYEGSVGCFLHARNIGVLERGQEFFQQLIATRNVFFQILLAEAPEAQPQPLLAPDFYRRHQITEPLGSSLASNSIGSWIPSFGFCFSAKTFKRRTTSPFLSINILVLKAAYGLLLL